MAAETSVITPKWLSHVALRVRNVERAVDFYTRIVGLKLHNQRPGAAFLGVREETSHELALFELGENAAEPDPERVGMYHASWEMPSWEALQQLHGRLLESGARITGYSDRACNVMFLDPDGNELEAFWEVPHELRERAAQPGGPTLPRLNQA